MTMAAAARGARARSAKGARGTSFRQAEPRPLVLLTGSDDYQAARAFDRIRDLAKAQEPELTITRFEASSYQPGELLLAASPSLFGGRNLVEFHGLAQMNEAAQKDLTGYVASPDPDVCVVLHHSGGNRGKSLLDALKKTATVIDCAPYKKETEKADFVHAEFKAARRRIAPDAVTSLVAAVGNDLAELGSACKQLMEDAEADVTAEQVNAYFGGRVETTGFAVADAALAGRGAQAVSLLRHALATGIDPVPLVSALGLKIRSAARVAGMPTAEAASTWKMAPWQVNQAQEVARRLHPDALAQCVRLVAQTDALVKGEGRDPPLRRGARCRGGVAAGRAPLKHHHDRFRPCHGTVDL
jgi:DNA polymerase-3 subunit delta